MLFLVCFGSSRFTSFYHNCRSAFSQAHTNGLSCPCVFYSQDKTATANQNSLSVLIALHIVQYSFLSLCLLAKFISLLALGGQQCTVQTARLLEPFVSETSNVQPHLQTSKFSPQPGPNPQPQLEREETHRQKRHLVTIDAMGGEATMVWPSRSQPDVW